MGPDPELIERARGGDPTAMEDLLFRGEARLSTWLDQIARSLCVKQRRPEIGEAIAAALATLPLAHREAVMLRDVEGRPAEDAAALAGVSVRALKSRLHRGRRALREQLQARFGQFSG